MSNISRESAELTAFLDDQAHELDRDRARHEYQFTAFEEFTPEEQAKALARTIQAGRDYRRHKAEMHQAACRLIAQERLAQTQPVGAHGRAPGKE